MLVAFVWISLVFAAVSQVRTSGDTPLSFLLAGLSHMAIFVLLWKMRLRPGTIKAWLTTSSMVVFASSVFLVAPLYPADESVYFIAFFCNSFFAFLISLTIFASLVGLAFSGKSSQEIIWSLDANQLLEYLVPSACSMLYMFSFAAYSYRSFFRVLWTDSFLPFFVSVSIVVLAATGICIWVAQSVNRDN